jgi:hypothetical protein
MTSAFAHHPPTEPASTPATPRKALTEADAVDIWIARWLRVRRRDLLARYGCDPRRLYEVWNETRFPGSRGKALELFRAQYPWASDRIDPGPHRTAHRTPDPRQLPLFD